ncbi:MAG: NAD(P)-dependent oxidoreductase [Vicinamibacterales bacterium]
MKRVLLTGASGFIGHHCLSPLLSRGYEVHAVSTRNGHSSAEGVTWHRANLLQAGAAKALISEVAPTHLLHLAWYVEPGKLISSSENFEWVRSSLELSRAFAEGGGQRFVASGTGYEYDWKYGYCTEELTPAVPNTVYGACKHAVHLLVQSVAEQAKLSAAWGRVFFLYGPCEHPDRLVSSVIRSLLKGEPARCSHGRQIRDYMHVQDVATGLVALLDSQVQGTVNVSSGQATTLRDIVQTVGSLLGRSELIQLGALPARANDAALVVGENSRLLNEVGWTQQFDLDRGLRETIEWWRVRV